MFNTYLALFCFLFTNVSLATAADETCAGQACGGSNTAPWVEADNDVQALEMLQVHAAKAAQEPAPAPVVDVAETPTEKTPMLKSICAKGDRVFKATNMTGVECQERCGQNEFCKFWSHPTDMEVAGDCIGCKSQFTEMAGYTTMVVGDLLVMEEKVPCPDVGFLVKEPNNGPTCEEPNTYCGLPGSPGCAAAAGEEGGSNRRRNHVLAFPGKRTCKCGNQTGYSEAGLWCRNCHPYPLGSADVSVVSQAVPIEGAGNVKQIWVIPKPMVRAPFQICCDEEDWATGCPACCTKKKDECSAKCPMDDKKACANDCDFQSKMCSGLCADQIKIEKLIAGNMTGMTQQCKKV
mmetsp:Transcript_130581/g.227001  ORF Transcript_130581/g.227001 Transcript_130581/m.227001 type:complete len:349 (+) Transcript_130581:83-1129(+)